jgi:hypothetical protein
MFGESLFWSGGRNYNVFEKIFSALGEKVERLPVHRISIRSNPGCATAKVVFLVEGSSC